MQSSVLDEVKRIKAITDIGLLYASNEYEKERYHELREISFRLLERLTHASTEDIKSMFSISSEYPTAKVDIRAFIQNEENEILLVKESADEKWSLPGGWADVGFSPMEVVIKECHEEIGLHVVPKTLLAVFDKRKHNHPPQSHYVYKLIFYCTAIPGSIKKGFDILDVNYFAIDRLPSLSEDRILKEQIQMLQNKVLSNDWHTWFD
jgi:ADP-ribose pyrophosphatase YjhB (NUDIX family)